VKIRERKRKNAEKNPKSPARRAAIHKKKENRNKARKLIENASSSLIPWRKIRRKMPKWKNHKKFRKA